MSSMPDDASPVATADQASVESLALELIETPLVRAAREHA